MENNKTEIIIDQLKKVEKEKFSCDKILIMYHMCKSQSDDCEYMDYWVDKKCPSNKSEKQVMI